MGTAQLQGELWGARARDWVEVQEPAWRYIFDRALSHAGVTLGSKLLDIGCGAGGALALARERGAEITGLDASENLVAIARERLPGARIEIGEMEALPFRGESFDVVTGLNSFQFAGDPVQALSEARRVCRPGGTVFMLMWGRREDCQLITITMPAVFALLPPSPTKDTAPVSLAEDGVAEDFMRKAGLEQVESGLFSADLAFPDTATAVRAVLSASARAIRAAGEERVSSDVRETLGHVTRPDGSVVWKNRFRWHRTKRPTECAEIQTRRIGLPH